MLPIAAITVFCGRAPGRQNIWLCFSSLQLQAETACMCTQQVAALLLRPQ